MRRTNKRPNRHDQGSTSGRRRDAALILSIVALACLLRLVYVVQLADSPGFHFPVMDEKYHDDWAQAIAAGQQFVDGPYFRAPLYPAFVGGLYRVFGHNYYVPRIAQALIGALSCGLLFLIGKQVFSRAVGAAAGFVAATYWMLIYFDGELLIPTIIVFLDLVMIWCLLPRETRHDRLRLGAAGIALGLSAIARPNILLFAPAVAVWIVVMHRAAWRRAVLPVVCFTVGCMIPVLPVTVRNLVVGDDLVLIASQGGVNFYIGNNPDSNGMVAQVPGTPADWWGGYYASIARAEEARGRKLKPSEVSDYYFEQAWEFMKSNPSVAAALMLRKLHLFWRRWEISNNKDIYFWTERFTPIVRFLPLSFGIVGPLGLLGLFLSRRRAGALFPLWGFVLVYMISVVLFFCTARYRMPVLPILILLGTFAAFRMVESVRHGQKRQIAVMACTLMVSACFVWIGPGPDSMKDDSNSYQTLAVAYEKQGRLDMAAASFAAAADVTAGHAKVDVLTRLAKTLATAGKRAEAKNATKRALEIDPHDAHAHDLLGGLLSEEGRFADADRQFNAAIADDPALANAYYNRGLNFLRQQRIDEAMTAFQTCIELDNAHTAARNNLANLLVEKGRLKDAAWHLERALELDPGSPVIHNNLGSIYRDMGRLDEAAAQYLSAIRLNRGYANAYWNLGRLLLGQGHPEEAMAYLYESVRVSQGDPQRALDLAWMLATHTNAKVRNGTDAVALAEHACRQLGTKDARALDVLAAALAEHGNYERARETARQALQIVTAANQADAIDAIRKRLTYYEKNHPYRDSPE